MMKGIKKIGKYKRLLLMLIDICIIIATYFLVQFFVRDTLQLNSEVFNKILFTALLAVVIYEFMLNIFKLYKNIIRYESGKDYLVYILACLISSAIVSTIISVGNLNLLQTKYNLVTSLLIAMVLVSYRIIVRLIITYGVLDSDKRKLQKNKEPRKLLIIGAGSATNNIVKSIKENMKHIYNIVGIIDDDPEKIGGMISGVPVLGDRNSIIDICKQKSVEIIFFSISNISSEDRKEIIDLCQDTNVKVRILPSTEDIIRNKKLLENLRDVEIDDILGRDPIHLDNENIAELIEDKVILVTGGGGSIGSELCRQIVKYNPKQLVIFDIYENNLYEIEMELKRNYPNINVKAIVGSVRDFNKVEKIFSTYKPYLVFHAAAHKHVPLMEVSPLEAIKNNVFGTYNVVNVCDLYNVKRFVLISTDKAVNPTSIMGATKRICEMIVQTKNKTSNTEFVAVRFGNVLGSNGSVVPLFKKQIASGGPVTVTHKEITRFFMTIPEAVQLVLQAITYAKGGEIFVLDMGKPVKIYDLAVSLIKLSGFEPDVDIPIKITGLRPGEKLYEELLMAEEGLEKTQHDKIFVAEPLQMKESELEERLNVLRDIIKDENNDVTDVKNAMKYVVPTFIDAEEANLIKKY